MFWFVFVCNLLLPFLQIMLGLIMEYHPPKRINRIYGYRTRRSMKNTDTWAFAQKHCGRSLWLVGIITLIPSVLVHLPFYHSAESTLIILAVLVVSLQAIVLILSALPTEIALKNTFRDDGTRK